MRQKIERVGDRRRHDGEVVPVLADLEAADLAFVRVRGIDKEDVIGCFAVGSLVGRDLRLSDAACVLQWGSYTRC